MSTSEAMRRGIGHMHPDQPKLTCGRCGETKPETCFRRLATGKRRQHCKGCTPEPKKRRDRATAHFARMGYS